MKKLALLFVVIALVGLDAPLARKKVDRSAWSFAPEDVERIAVLPVADVRKDHSIELKHLDTIGHRAVQKSLKKSTYELAFLPDRETVASITPEDLDYMDSSWIADLGPEDERYVMLLVLEDIAKKKTFGSAFGSICSGYLLDHETGEAIWQSQQTGTAGQGGLLGMAMGPAMRGGAFEACASNLMKELPKVKGKKKREKTSDHS